jgi:hypothetical protein
LSYDFVDFFLDFVDDDFLNFEGKKTGFFMNTMNEYAMKVKKEKMEEMEKSKIN